MKAKKLLSVLLAVCMVLSVLPMALFTAGAEYEALTDYLTVACTANTNGGSNRDATNDYGSHGVNNEANNISTVNGSVAVYSIDFGEDTYSSIQIHYSGRTSGRCPTSANANIYLGDYWTDPEGCTLLGNVKLPPYGSENWDSRNLSTIAAFDGLTGTQTISVQYIGEDGYSTVSNARQMYFYKEALADLTSYVDAENATVSTASASKTGVGGGEGPARLFAGLGNKMGINFKEGETPTLTYVTTVPTTVYAYTYMTANDSAERDPKSWNFYGSSDGETWTLIDAVTDFSAPSTRCCWSDVLFKVDSPAEYSYYKLEITACKNITSGYCQLDEWRTYGTLYSGADAIEEVEALISAIAETEPLSDEYFAAIAAAEAAYDELGEVNQGYVTNSAALTEPSAVAKAKADGKDYTYIYNTIEQIKGFMPISYKSKTSLDLIESLYTDAVAKLGEADVKAYIVNYADAMNAKATYRKIIDDFSVTFTLSKDRMTTNNQKWLANQTDEEWNSTLAAMADTVKYFYAERMINIGIASGTTRSTENHDYVLGAQLESKPNDNCVSPWSSSRYWSYLIVPFSGMAFDVGGYMVINDNHKQAPLGEEFDLAADGRTYQVMWNKTISHVTTPRQNGKSITVDSVSVYPGSGDYASVIGNVFRYMYANYAQTNKWDGKTLGYPTADARLAGTATYYQNFLSDDGNAVLLSTADILGGVALAVDAEGYEAQLKSAAGSGFVLTGEMMDVIDSKGGAAAFFSSTGDLDVENSTADRLVFEKGTLTTAGFESTLSEDELKAMAAPVISLIDAIGEVTTLGPSGNKLAAIEAAEKAYDELLIDAREYVTNYTVLCDARAAYDALVDALEIYDSVKYITPISGRVHANEGFDKLFDNNYTNKLYMNKDSYADVVFSTATPVKVSGYIMSTGGDTANADNTPGGRNPVAWILYGSNDGGETWTEIINSALSLPAANNTPATMYLDAATAGYTYFKAAFTMSSVGKMQLGELALLTEKEANYDAVLAALKKVPEDLSIYTSESIAALNNAIGEVQYNLPPSEQATVDGYAAAIEAAISALVPKSVEMELTISTGMVTAAAEGKYDITWNARILLGEELKVEDINAAGVKFKNYGVYYGTGKDVLNDYKNATADQIRQVVFDKGEDIDVYTAYGFRLKNVVENRVRAAMFYVEYELNGQTYILLSTVDEVVAVIAE